MKNFSSFDVFKNLVWDILAENKFMRNILLAITGISIISCWFEFEADSCFSSVVNYVKNTQNSESFNACLGQYMLYYFMHCLLGWFHNFLFGININTFKSIIYKHLIETYMKMNYDKYHEIGSGKLCSYINKQTDSSIILFREIFIKLLYSLFYLTIFFHKLFFNEKIDIVIKIFILVAVILIASLTIYGLVFRNERKARLLSSEHSVSNVLLDIFKNFNIVKSFNSESVELSKYEKAMQEPIVLGGAFYAFEETSKIAFKATMFLLSIIIISYGSLDTFRRAGDFITLCTMFSKFASQLKSAKEAVFAISERLVEMKLGIHIPENSSKKPFNISQQSLTLEFKSVAINIKDTAVLSGLSLFINPGDKIAITGCNGSGKSTIIKTLLGFYKYDGDIMINGEQLSNINEESLRSHLSYVSQEPHLFNVSVMDNLRYGKIITDERIIEICIECGTHQIFKNLKDGYSTVVGENNKNISGGQAQMINFMRAVIRDGSIFLLDEPTSNLDYSKSKLLVNKIFEALIDKTVLFSTHNPLHLARFDKIINISNHSAKIFNGYDEFRNDPSTENNL